MPFDNQGVLARLDVLGDQDSYLDFMVSDLLVGSCVNVKAVEAGLGCCFERRHIVFSFEDVED